jgi:hypothetical protein
VAVRYARSKAHPVLGEVSRPLDRRAWQLLLLLASEADGSWTTTELAEKSGIGETRVEELLDDLAPAEVRLSNGCWMLTPSLVARVIDREDDVRSALARTNRALSQESRSTGRSRAVDILTLLDRAELLRQQSQPDRAMAMVSGSGLTLGKLLGQVEPKKRGLLRARFVTLAVETRMNLGESGNAILVAAPLLGNPNGAPAELMARLFLSLSAAYRMTGSYRKSVDIIDRAEHVIDHNSIAPDVARRFRRWIHSARGTPLALLGEHTVLSKELERAGNLVASSDEWAENELYLIRQLLLQGHVAEARARLDAVRAILPQLPKWLLGWYYRYEVDVLAGGSPQAIAASAHAYSNLERRTMFRSALIAWESNTSLGFQQDLILVRIAVIRAQREDEEAVIDEPRISSTASAKSFASVLDSVHRHVARLHRMRHAIRPSECSTCRMSPLWKQIEHALQFDAARLHHLT